MGWDSFKWRNHQPDIGRFFNIDPLADEYVYNSPYAFAENKLGMGVELEGLELEKFPWLTGSKGDSKPAPGWHPPMTSDYTTTTTKTTSTQSITTVTNAYTGESTVTVVNRKYDVDGGKYLPAAIATKDSKGNEISVSVSFLNTSSDGKNSNNAIKTEAVDGFVSTIQEANKMDAGITSVSVSATTNGNHAGGWLHGSSNHYKGAAIDIGLINGKTPSSADSTLQKAADKQSTINENFGPFFDHKKTNTTSDQKHNTWIHLSFN